MKNCRVNIRISGHTSGNEILDIPIDINIDPLYITPEEVLLTFADEGSKEWVELFERVLNITHLGSVSFDRFLDSNTLDIKNEKLRKALAESYTLCYALYWTGIRFFKNNLKSVSKSKTLADFTVSYRADSNSLPIDSIIKDAKECLDKIKREIEQYAEITIGKAKAFEFRRTNAKVNINDTRRWDYLPPEYGISYAASKRTLRDGNNYKTGAYYQYWMVGKIGYSNWGYDGQYSW